MVQIRILTLRQARLGKLTLFMNILVANERFLFRFGADRVLMIIARGLHAAGHRITMMANRYDRAVLEPFASQIIDVPDDQCPYFDLNEFTADWLRRTWQQHFTPDTNPDLVLVGGWPFLQALPVFRERSKSVVFMDFGVVPTDGYSEGTRLTLEKLIRLRRENLSSCSLVAGISDFISRTQSIPDSSGGVPVKTVLLGADHMEMGLWPAESGLASQDHYGINLLASLQRQGRPVILSLGRWETGCYKNSQGLLELMRMVRSTVTDCAVLVLAEPAQMDIPPDLLSTVYPIFFPSDHGLTQIMRRVDLGVSMSLWEGFNLPLAEMQWLGNRALVFNIGAHPEVVANPWYLCEDTADMAQKIGEVLSGRGPGRVSEEETLKQFRKRFTWDRVVREYEEIVGEFDGPKPVATILPRDKSDHRVHLIIDVTNSTKDPANSGVIRVTRRAGRTLQDYEDPLFVIWDSSSGQYVLPTSGEAAQLGQFNGPAVDPGRLSASYEKRTGLDSILEQFGTDQPWLFCPEIIMEERFRNIRPYARARGLRLAAVFHDAIPVLRPDLCNDEMRNNHAAYMRGLAECDVVLPNSNYSANCLRDFWRDHGVAGCEVVSDLLPGEFAGAPRNLRVEVPGAGEVRILCVSTLEPRKNHRRLINSCLRMQEKHPGLDWSLTLVGNRYEGAMQLADWVEGVCRGNSRIRWMGIVNDATLYRLYQEATFTVYASTIEGFGMPIVESIWHGRPCLCADHGVMAELAVGGGCLTVDVDDEERLAEAIYSMATDRDLLLRLTREAVVRPMKTWVEYGTTILDTLSSQAPAWVRARPMAPAKNLVAPHWHEILYPNCVLDRWQMNESEKLTLTGLLARLRPQCSLDVGTYCGGSLSLIAQFSRMTFSIDIDPTVPERLRNIPNVRFLTGSSPAVVPKLLAELDSQGIPVEFILIDADHSGEGIKRDIEWLTNYVPMKPLFVALHDSFNPNCRRGMMEGVWDRSPYCQWVDLDFVPGRLIEHGGGGTGEMWGGLALAFFQPTPRNGPLTVGRSAEQMFQAVQAVSISALAAA
jgi:glycosyltransferase involved in cell wall biosynthesis